MNARTVNARSRYRPARIAERTPNRTPNNSQITAPPIVTESVAGRSWITVWSTLSCWVYEITDPSKIFSIVLTYWTYTGLSKPHSLRIESTWAGVEYLPASRKAGSPLGIAWKIRKVRT